jgi:hypothetical protein
MEKKRMSISDILEGIKKGFEIGGRSRVKIVPGDNGDLPRLTYELESRNYDYYVSKETKIPKDSYQVNLKEIDLI